MRAVQRYKGKKVLVLGLARSGLAACNLLLKYGANVTGYDINNFNKIPSEIRDNVELVCGVLPQNIDPSKYDKVITSPGIPPDNPIIKNALKHGSPVISELELGLDELPPVKIIAVTGTNGKTTTCKLIEYITGGKVAGNIGTPLTSYLENISEGDLLILEVSSYQIPFSQSLVPDVGIILNVFPEHLNWHKGFENYVVAKKEMFLRQTFSDVGIFNADMENIDEFLAGIKSRKVFFSLKKEVPRGVFTKDDDIIYIDKDGMEEVLLTRKEITLSGEHNLQNLMAAIAAWKAIGGMKLPDIRGFKLPPHRLEKIGVFDNIKFINDSKATNMDSTLRALESVDKPIVLLMGGRSKNQIHPDISEMVKNKVTKIIAFGESRKEVMRYFSEVTGVIESRTLKEATQLAFKVARPGDTVLLSPGGSSFDEFSDYCERGLKFRKWVKELAEV